MAREEPADDREDDGCDEEDTDADAGYLTRAEGGLGIRGARVRVGVGFESCVEVGGDLDGRVAVDGRGDGGCGEARNRRGDHGGRACRVVIKFRVWVNALGRREQT